MYSFKVILDSFPKQIMHVLLEFTFIVSTNILYMIFILCLFSKQKFTRQIQNQLGYTWRVAAPSLYKARIPSKTAAGPGWRSPWRFVRV